MAGVSVVVKKDMLAVWRCSLNIVACQWMFVLYSNMFSYLYYYIAVGTSSKMFDVKDLRNHDRQISVWLI
jgi:hypothetical protein